MQYGDWQLRKDSAYYPSQNVTLYPSSNSSDKGSLHIESNVRAIVRRITSKSYKLHETDFTVSINQSRDVLTVGPGDANIQGYHLIANTSVSIKVPTTTSITPYTLGISLSYDAANNVTGDVVAYDRPTGENEYFSGAYLYFFNPCQLRENYDNILVLGRVWVKDGCVVTDGTYIPADPDEDESNPYNGYYLERGFEPDPFNDHAVKGSSVEVQIEGAKMNSYDALQSLEVMNIADISRYATMNYEAEQDPSKYTKPPSITTDLQDFLNYMIDWYPSKFGDYMTGALRFDQLSLDAKRVLDSDYDYEYVKDSPTAGTSGAYHNTAGVFISPRNLRTLSDRSVVDLDSGGTLMTIVPQTYSEGTDFNNGDSAIYAALMSTKDWDTGLRIHGEDSGTSKIVHDRNTTNLLIENHAVDTNDRSSIYFELGQLFVDSYNSKGIQLYSSSSSTSTDRTVAFRFDDYNASVIWKEDKNHRESAPLDTTMGLSSSSRIIEYGSGCSYNGTRGIDNHNPYAQIGNLNIRSIDAKDNYGEPLSRKISTLELTFTGTTENHNGAYHYQHPDSIDAFPYLRILPGIYTHNELIQDYIQVGVNKEDDVRASDAISNTSNRVIIYKHSREDSNANDDHTVIEQDFLANTSDGSVAQIFNVMTPLSNEPSNNNHTSTYREIGGIYSFGNIGASSHRMKPYEGRTSNTGPYQDEDEWVRFTRFRYDKDSDKQFGGTYTETNHSCTYGTPYNIEFNTTVKNRRANQIIWSYYDKETEKRHQPLTLSYIHDEEVESRSAGEKYQGTAYPDPIYYDHNMYLHKNPTYSVRDFLRIDGGGLSVHGDINNPTLAGDANNSTESFGITLLQGRVYSGVYNDYAETYEKADTTERAVEGMVVMLDEETGKYRICDQEESTLVVGVISDNYGMLIGGKSINSTKDHMESAEQIENFAVGVSGKLIVNLISDDVRPGDLLVAASKPGLAKTIKDRSKIIPGTIIGKALSKAQPVEGENYYRCLMQIMLS